MPIKRKILALGRPLRVLSGEKVFVQGKRARSLYYLCSGSIVTCFSSATGQEAMVVDVPSGHFVPVAALLAGTASYIVDGIAQSDCELVAIEITKLRKLLLEDAGVSNFFLEISLQRLQRVLHQFVDAALLGASERIAKWLIDVARDQNTKLINGMVIQLDMSTHVVGLATAGMARETISRQLTWLVSEGIIERSKKSVKVIDIARLEALCVGTAIARKHL
jgi:CRP/FNR family cyclic AMP-dependent transcriptional regulator